VSSVTFETATLADAVRKAARFAPTKGAELDKAGGIMIELEEPMETPVVTLRSTNLSVFYRQTIRPVRMSLNGTEHWRVSSVLLENIVSKLPMTLGATVTIADDGDSLKIKAGKIRSQIRLYDPDAHFPNWAPFDPSGLEVVEGFAQRVAQVKWACEQKAGTVLAGVHIDGEHLWATDRTTAVRVPLACPVDRPVTVPLSDLLDLVRDHPEVALRAAEDALEVMPDEDTQVRVMLLAGEYPRSGLHNFLGFPVGEPLVLDRQQILPAIERLMVLDSGDRYPVIKVELGDEMRFRREVPDVGWIDEAIELRAPTEPYSMWINPTALREAIQAIGGGEIELAHGAGPLDAYAVRDGRGFIAMTMPRKVSA
jgi:DNA polymerase III sliding clamp (beta) subunit (PCNA family)